MMFLRGILESPNRYSKPVRPARSLRYKKVQANFKKNAIELFINLELRNHHIFLENNLPFPIMLFQ